MDKGIMKSTLAEYLVSLDTKLMLKQIQLLHLDKYTKKLDSIKLTQLLLFAQVNQISSLTSLSRKLNETKELQSEIGIQSISASQLSRKLRHLEQPFLDAVLQHCIAQLVRRIGLKKATKQLGRINLVDSSTITLCLSQYPWAQYLPTHAGVKLHLRLAFVDGLVHPDKAILTPAKPSDRTQMDSLIELDRDALYIFDRGYVDYRKFDEYCRGGTRFVTRLRYNTSIAETYERRTIPQGSPVLRDDVVRIGSSASRSMTHPTRWIETLDSEGNLIIILTNDLTMDAVEIGDLYRRRWQIELFFKWIKQHLKVKSMYGKSENAVFNQLRIALIAFCLLLLLQLRVSHNGRVLLVYRCLQNTWAQPFEVFLRCLNRPPSRSSPGRKKMKHAQIFSQTLQQYVDGDIEHLDDLEYDPV